MTHRIGVAVQVNGNLDGTVIAKKGSIGVVEQWPQNELDGRQLTMSAVRFNPDHPFLLIPDDMLVELHPNDPAYRAQLLTKESKA